MKPVSLASPGRPTSPASRLLQVYDIGLAPNLTEIPSLANQPIGMVQLAGFLRGLAHLQRRRAAARDLVGVVSAEQAPISPLDLRRLTVGRHTQQQQRLLVSHGTARQ